IAVGVVGVVELLPNLAGEFRTSRANVAMIADIDATVVEPLDAALPDGARVLIAPNAAGGNDFIASYLATGADIALYNIGGDKSLADARANWSPTVLSLLSGTQTIDPDDVITVLRDGTAEAVVVPYFDLRWSIEKWPPAEQFSEPGLIAVDQLSDSAELEVDRSERFAVVTLRARTRREPESTREHD
ncbi:hypothetical protein JS562_52400, partial [Agrobacterium sp. S2]|nr:hypothetical protein [Agrobacterium sp. S2]